MAETSDKIGREKAKLIQENLPHYKPITNAIEALKKIASIPTNLSGLLAIRENIRQNFLLQKVETSVDIDATIVSNRIVTERRR